MRLRIVKERWYHKIFEKENTPVGETYQVMAKCIVDKKGKIYHRGSLVLDMKYINPLPPEPISFLNPQHKKEEKAKEKAEEKAEEKKEEKESKGV
jgi:hypothetical protein